MPIGKLTSLAVTGPNALELQWDDERTAQVNLAEVVSGHAGLKSIRSPKAFADATLSSDGWSVEWPNGIDFGSSQLRRWAEEQAGETMSAIDFRKWMEVHGLTLDGASWALGLSRRMIAYYLSGEKSIPKTVLLATAGWESQKNEAPSVKAKAAVEEQRGDRFTHRPVKMPSKSKTYVSGRNSSTGEFIPVKAARSRPSSTVVERLPKPGHTSAKSRQHVSSKGGSTSPNSTVSGRQASKSGRVGSKSGDKKRR